MPKPRQRKFVAWRRTSRLENWVAPTGSRECRVGSTFFFDIFSVLEAKSPNNLHVFPQQLGKLRSLANKASGWFGAAVGNLAPGSARFRSEGSTHKTLGSARFGSEGSIHHKRLVSARFHSFPNTVESLGLANKASGWFGAAAGNLAPGSTRFHKKVPLKTFEVPFSRFHIQVPLLKLSRFHISAVGVFAWAYLGQRPETLH